MLLWKREKLTSRTSNFTAARKKTFNCVNFSNMIVPYLIFAINSKTKN